jgi:hypothetical protein
MDEYAIIGTIATILTTVLAIYKIINLLLGKNAIEETLYKALMKRWTKYPGYKSAAYKALVSQDVAQLAISINSIINKMIEVGQDVDLHEYFVALKVKLNDLLGSL